MLKLKRVDTLGILYIVRILCLYLIRIDLSTTVLVHVVNTKLRTQYTVLEGKKRRRSELRDKLPCSFPECLLLIG